jgi:hypothetical protein
MALQKNFLKPSIEQLPIPKWQWILNILIHIGLALMFYLFLIYSTEILKFVFSQPADAFFIKMKYTSQPNSILTKIMVAFFSILFAEAFLIQSIFFKTSLLKSHHTLKKRHKTKIFDDYRLIVFMAFIFFFKLVMLNIYLNTSVHFFLSKEKGWILNIVLIFLNIVLYLQLWVYLRWYFSNTFKWLVIIFAINTLLALTFAVIPLNNLDKYYHNLSENAIDSNYDIDFAKVKNAEKAFRRSTTINAFFAYPKNEEKTEPVLVFQYYHTDTILHYDDISVFLDSARTLMPEYKRPFLTINIAIGLDVEMKYVYKLHNEFRKANALKIDYAVNFDDLVNSYFNSVLQEKLYPSCLAVYDENDFKTIDILINQDDAFIENFGCILIERLTKSIKGNQNIHQLKSNHNQISLNDENISTENLKSKLIALSTSNENIILEIRVDEHTHFETYIKTLDALESVRKHLFGKYAQKMFQTSFDNLYREEQKQVNDKYYHHFYPIKLTPREWKYYDYLK